MKKIMTLLGALRIIPIIKKEDGTMKRSFFVRFTALILLLTTLVGCSGGDSSAKKDEVQLTQMQRQSLAMLNYLTALTQEITVSSNNRLFLETAYASLFDNTFPEIVDDRTRSQLTALTDGLESFRMISVKRDRLQYLYEQDRAKALENQLPSPQEIVDTVSTDVGAVLSGGIGAIGTEAGMVDPKTAMMGVALKATVSIGCMIFGEETTDMESLERQYLQDGWELDDAAAQVLHNVRQDAFLYMCDIARDNNIPGEYTLTEKTVSEFITWKNSDNLTGRIQFLETHKDTYELYGDYWIVLATSYYDNGDYQKCIDSVHEYEEINKDLKIFRKDYSYANVLPMYIVSVREVYKTDKYTKIAPEYLDLILVNSDDNDWVNRYFVTEAYIDLYHLTNDTTQLQKAYNVMLNLVNTLMGEQQALNKLYVDEISKVDIAEGASKEQKDDANEYNQMVEVIRETELPPISEPLRICGEMLFVLADELNVSETEREKITNILHNDGADAFYNLIYDNEIRFNPDETDPQIANMTVKYDAEGNLKLPVILVTQNSHIKVSAVSKSKTTVLEDWTLKKVERKGENVEEFLAVYKSKKAAAFEYKDGMAIIIEIYGSPEAETPNYTVEFKAKVDTTLWLFDDVSFKRVS